MCPHMVRWKAGVEPPAAFEVELGCILWFSALRNLHRSVVIGARECAMGHGNKFGITCAALNSQAPSNTIEGSGEK